MPESSFEQLMQELDEIQEPIEEHKFASKIQKWIKDNPSCNLSDLSILAERMAFNFSADCQDEDSGWGTYYGPISTITDEKGAIHEWPSINSINHDVMQYWQHRAQIAKNPVMKLRYADLVWDFSKIVKADYAKVTMAEIIIEQTIIVASNDDVKYSNDIVCKLRRALGIAIAIDDMARIARLMEITIKYETRIADDNLPATWGIAYDLLICNKNLHLTAEQEANIIGELETRLDNFSKSKDLQRTNPFAIEAAVMLLAQHYRKMGKAIELERILLVYVEVFTKIAQEADPMIAAAWLKKVYDNCCSFGLKKKADELNALIHTFGEKSSNNMKPIACEFAIDKKKMEADIEKFIDAELEFVFARLAFRYLPKKDKATEKLKEIARNSISINVMSRTIIDDDGRPVACVGPLGQDLEGNLMSQLGQDMAILSVFLREIIKRMIDKFSLNQALIVDYLYSSPVFDEDKKELITIGIESYLKKDYINAIHVLVPQIEHLLRRIAAAINAPIYDPGRYRSLKLRNIDKLLTDPQMNEALGDDVTFYLRALLSDPRGWNLRNRICHGMAPKEVFGPEVADRIFHSFLLLSQCKIVEEKPD